MDKKYDFCGWATRNDLLCSDGRTIKKDAFKHNDGMIVPLVWNHLHNDTDNILGHALLENRDEGVYTYGTFNNTESGQRAKKLVAHGDITNLSIYANHLKQNEHRDVMHGEIREVSLVLAGANKGAYIETVIEHSDDTDESGIMYIPDELAEFSMYHAEEPVKEEPKKEEKKEEAPVEDKKTDETTGKTVGDVMDAISKKVSEEEMKTIYGLIGLAASGKTKNTEGETDMKHNVFDNNEYEGTENDTVLSHDDMKAIIDDARRYGSLKDSVLAHGITDIDILFPDAKNYTNEPIWIKRRDDWVAKVLNGTHHTPYSRIKSIFANITADEARAKGYVKGNKKVDEVFTLLKRSTTPTTIYKKQSFDRDDIIDITDFDAVSWVKGEMRGMLDEEIARAILVGDGRLASSDDKISELNIRPIWTDDDLYTIKRQLSFASTATASDRARQFIKSCVDRKDYKGSGSPTLFAEEDIITECLLLEDLNQRRIYNNLQDLALAMRVKEIITVPVLDGLTREVSGTTYNLMGIIVNLDDYNVGADKGGAVNMFDDFDIDYNKQKYLIETRCSGAMVKPYAAIVLEYATAVSAS